MNESPARPETRRYRLRSKILLLLSTLFLCLLVAEGVARLVYPSGRLEYAVDPETLFCIEPNQQGFILFANETKRSPMIVIDEHGFRSNGTQAPPAGEVSVLALGDSTTFGWGVADNETFCAQMEQLSGGNLSVINAGVPGWGVFQEEILLKRVIDQVDPDYVLVTILEGDVLRQPFKSEQETKAYLASHQWRQFIRRSSRLLTICARQLDRWTLLLEGKAVPNQRPLEDDEAQGPSTTFRTCWSDDRKRLIAMHELVEMHGGKLIIVAWPQQTRNTEFFLQEVAELGQQLRVTVVDLSDTLARHDPKDMKIPNDSHPTAYAHRIVADEFLKAILPDSAKIVSEDGENAGVKRKK